MSLQNKHLPQTPPIETHQQYFNIINKKGQFLPSTQNSQYMHQSTTLIKQIKSNLPFQKQTQANNASINKSSIMTSNSTRISAESSPFTITKIKPNQSDNKSFQCNQYQSNLQDFKQKVDTQHLQQNSNNKKQILIKITNQLQTTSPSRPLQKIDSNSQSQQKSFTHYYQSNSLMRDVGISTQTHTNEDLNETRANEVKNQDKNVKFSKDEAKQQALLQLQQVEMKPIKIIDISQQFISRRDFIVQTSRVKNVKMDSCRSQSINRIHIIQTPNNQISQRISKHQRRNNLYKLQLKNLIINQLNNQHLLQQKGVAAPLQVNRFSNQRYQSSQHERKQLFICDKKSKNIICFPSNKRNLIILQQSGCYSFRKISNILTTQNFK
eukprot:403372128